MEADGEILPRSLALQSVNGTIQLIRLREQPGTASPNHSDRSNLSSTATCSSTLAEDPWVFDAQAPSYGPGASMWDVLPAAAPRQSGLPNEYRQASPAELDLRIRAAKHALGDRLVMLGHFYQRDEVVQYADFVGDSFQLAQAARSRPKAEAIVFCGVHFMAETADMLSRVSGAGCHPSQSRGRVLHGRYGRSGFGL